MMIIGWTLNASADKVLDALATYLENHEECEYRLSHSSGVWTAAFRRDLEVGTGTFTMTGHGSTAHAATIQLFEVAEIPAGYDVSSDVTVDDDHDARTSIFDRNLNPAGSDRHA